MPLKIAPAFPEEYAFATEVNKRLASTGARILPFTMTDPESQASTYHLTFQLGPKRHTIAADAPFHLDSPDDVVGRVHDWIAGVGATERYSPDLKYAE
jgi:hypothetical protein